MNKGVVFTLLLTLSGCSTLGMLNAVNPLKEDKGISATAQIGKENISDTSKQLLAVKAGDSIQGNQTKSKEMNEVFGNQTINKTTNIPWWSALLLLFVRPMVVLRDTLDLFRGKRDE